MFWNTFFEAAILKFTYVLKLIFWWSNYFKFLIHGCCFLAWLLSILICMYPFYTYFLSVRTCMNVKRSKILIFFLLRTLWHKYQIMNSNIYPHNNVTTKSWILIVVMTILQLKTFKIQFTSNTSALIYLGLYGLVAKRISHTTFNIPCLSWKEFESCEEQILHVASQL